MDRHESLSNIHRPSHRTLPSGLVSGYRGGGVAPSLEGEQEAGLVRQRPVNYAGRVMKPIVNLEETPGKVVGRVRPIRYDSLVDLAEGLMPRLPYPKGVYRFRTFEEADSWKSQHLLQAAVTKSRARQG